MTYFDPEPLAYVVDEAEMEKKVEMIVWHYKEWCKGSKQGVLNLKRITKLF